MTEGMGHGAWGMGKKVSDVRFQESFVDRFWVALLVSSFVFRLRFLFAVTD
jgi:hypothetical protein